MDLCVQQAFLYYLHYCFSLLRGQLGYCAKLSPVSMLRRALKLANSRVN